MTSQYPLADELSLIIAIPCYNEPDVLLTLESLISCDIKGFGVEIIVVVNSYQHTPENISAINQKTFEDICALASECNTDFFRIIPLQKKNLPGKQTGAGLPRKISMDEAIRRFLLAGNENGVIVSLDADCTVDNNYLSEIYRNFKNDDKLYSSTIRFHHPVERLDKNDPIRLATLVYEKYLHYYKSALEYSGYPYAYHTVGSAFAVRAIAYVKAGGMGKQQAGEDFYFLQKVFPLGKTIEINTTTVYPAARLSDRVPFGTGPSIIKMLEDEDIVKYTYNIESFRILRSFFSQINNYFKAPLSEIKLWTQNQPICLCKFLENDNFYDKMIEINKYTASLDSYRKRFFNYFNAFKILKFLNHVHPEYFDFIAIRPETLLHF
jgi:hypothetical protein